MTVVEFRPDGTEKRERLPVVLDRLDRNRHTLAGIPVRHLIGLLDDFAGRVLLDDGARRIEGIAYLSSWLKARNLQSLLERNLGQGIDVLDGFVPVDRGFIAAKPRGIVAMWVAGNVPTLSFFSLAPALLAKCACVVKLPGSDLESTRTLVKVLASSGTADLSGRELLEQVAFVWFDRGEHAIAAELSRRADARVIWGGREAVEAVRRLPQPAHGVELVFGPRYSIAVIDAARLEGDDVEALFAAIVRDIAAFDQRACSSPQTLFVEKNDRLPLRAIGELLGRHLDRLPPKPGQDAYTTIQITNARAEWAMHEGRDVVVDRRGPNWSVLLDRELSLKPAVQARTIFVTEVRSLDDVLPLLNPKVQTIGVAFGDQSRAIRFAEEATRRGVDRCVRPGLMNGYDSPWDGHLVVSSLVRWVTLKP
jgi:hypothetical protein